MSDTWLPQKIFLTPAGVTVEDNTPVEPQVFTLRQNAPNPFNAATTISFELYRPGEVSLRIYDMLGREVARLTEGYHTAGVYAVMWDGCDESGAPVSSGVYFYRLAAQGKIEAGRMTVVR